MEQLQQYFQETLGYEIRMKNVPKQMLDRLPLYIRKGFDFKAAELMGRELILLEAPADQDLVVQQVEKQFENIAGIFNKTLVLLINGLTAISRKKLVEKGINFIVPGRQMYLPSLLIDFNEVFKKKAPVGKTLLPSAQVILIYKILNRYEKIEELPLNLLAKKFNYTAMAITKAVDNLRYHDLCRVTGTKERYVHFDLSIPELWNAALPILTTPVLKQVYVDAIPAKPFMMPSNTSALPEYSEMAESRQKYLAVEKVIFYDLQKKNTLVNANEVEGDFCLEVWKYDPQILAKGINKTSNVDPLSLYLSLKDKSDARIELALDKIITDYIW